MNLSRVVRAEFHCHSVYSPDSLVRVEDLLAACEQKNIDKLAITISGSISLRTNRCS